MRLVETILLCWLTAAISQACVPSPIYKPIEADRKSLSPVLRNETIKTDEKTILGKASYYAKKFHGRQTANGEIFDMMKLNCGTPDIAF